MNKILLTGAMVGFVAVNSPSSATTLSFNCTKIASYSPSEIQFFYYKVVEADGEAEASRLWGAYHNLKNRCAQNPKAVGHVSVTPDIAAAIR
jgi:hypothetical protein